MLFTNGVLLHLFYFRYRIEYCHEFRENGSLLMTVTLAVLGRLKCIVSLSLLNCHDARGSVIPLLRLLIWPERSVLNAINYSIG